MGKNPMLEPEYIDRKKLLGKQKTIDGEPYVRLWDVLMAPVEDVVPVVRCKDCKFFEYGDYCSESKMEHSHAREDDFCSYGERKDGYGNDT